MNTASIIDRIEDIVNRDDFDRTKCLEQLNNLQLDLQNNTNFKFMEYLDETQVLVAGTKEYDSPSAMKAHISVVLLDESNDREYWLDEWRRSESDRYIYNTDTQQRPTFFEYFADSIILYPIPSSTEAGWKIRQRIYRYITALTDSTGSTNALTERFPNVLIWGGARDYYQSVEDFEAADRMHKGAAKGDINCYIAAYNALITAEAQKKQKSRSPRMSMRVR